MFQVGTKLLVPPPSNGVDPPLEEWKEAEIVSLPSAKKEHFEIKDSSSGKIHSVQGVQILELYTQAHRYKGTKIAKDFGKDLGGIFKGVVEQVSGGGENQEILFLVRYEDDDAEELDLNELQEAITLYKSLLERSNGKKRKVAGLKSTGLEGEEEKFKRNRKETASSKDDKEDKEKKIASNRVARKSPRSNPGRRRRSVVSYAESGDDLDDLLEEDEASVEAKPVKKKAKTSKKTPSRKAPAKMKKQIVLDSDDEESSVASFDSEETEQFIADSESEEEEMDFDSSDDEEEEEPVKKKRVGTTKNSRAKNKSPAGKTKKAEAPKKKAMKDSFDPTNYPLYSKMSLKEIREKKQFLDPCGQEATDDIISLLVGEQVDKIQGLLERAISSGQSLGSSRMPLQLGTACSGTDAPALALTLVQEQLALRNLKTLKYDHKFSCEVEPFKQAYLARNFDSILYPDICKIAESSPRDAYGQEQPIPEYNLFVAGTSCKNFSMMRANKRLDIEDRGCSGETFLAAVEHIFAHKPSFCVLENVQNAPWEKMAEYIEGKIFLGSASEKKAITGAKKDEKLVFCLDEESEKIIVDKVPSVFGVRCGSSVMGYCKPGDSLEHVRPVSWPSKKKSCTLDELVKCNKISMDNDTLVFDVPIRYLTKKVKVDTKDYGLPQTRNRMYLFVYKEEEGDLGEYWKLIVEHLKSPVRHSLEAFVLQDDHDIIRVFREALRGPAGRHTKRGAFLESDFWTGTSANLPHNKNSRAALGVEDMARPITSWGPFGQKKIPPHYWLEFLNCCNQRELDLIDILHASAARDAEGHDSSHASFFWNISQNATREKHRTACPGISGCVTPGGEFFLPHFGRPLLGCEKLLLQGIPYFRLALGTETEVQLGDLAGNAMSLTVVGATMLAAICCKQLREEAIATSESNPLNAAEKILKKSRIIRAPDLATSLAQDGNKDGLEFVQELAKLSEEAIRTSIWCTCETSGQNSASHTFFQCSVCKISCCQECCSSTAGYQLKSHSVTDITMDKNDRKLGDFDSKLRNILPPTILFQKEALADLEAQHNVSALANMGFNLHRIARVRGAWQIIYFCRERQVGEALAELSVKVGELSDGNQGALVEFRSFLPARIAPLKYGAITPIAVWKYHSNTSRPKQEWVGTKLDTVAKTLKIVGSNAGSSFRAEVGLTTVAAAGVNSGCKKQHNKKSFEQAKKLGEERRWLYPKNWNKWPDKLEISGCSDVDGAYLRAKCQQTINQNAAWIRTTSPPLYLLINPNVSRTGPDFGIISKSISHKDAASILAVLPESWQPSDALLSEFHTVKGVKFHEFFPLEKMKCLVPTSNISVSSPSAEQDNVESKSHELLSVHGLTDADCGMLALHAASKKNDSVVPLAMATGQKAQQTVRAFNSICVSKILQHAAANGIKYDLRPEANWQAIVPSNSNVLFGDCSKTFPVRPKELWRKDNERNDWERFYEAGESRAFYQALEKRPRAFEFLLDKTSNTLQVKLNPQVVGHYAAGHLSRGRGLASKDDIQVSVKLVASQFQSDPILDAFVVPGCNKETPAQVELKAGFELYERQQKVVSKMLAIENRETIFEEIEMFEEHMPGSTGWSLIAKAQRNARISGGVIADAIGAGKTVISIALILKGLQEARSRPKTDLRQSSATLVVVPSHLIDQWKSEFDKFTEGLKVHRIYDLKSLLILSLDDLITCDCVIVPVDILEAKGYLEQVLNMSGSTEEDMPRMPQYAGQKELNGATGTWIPATSADPYGGSNNSRNQERRNASARYTHVYLNAVHELRTKKFSKSKKGIPLEYFEWERIVIDEIHESLCCTKQEVDASNSSRKDGLIFKERNRRAGREFLGIMTRDPLERPLVARKAVFGLTGTPLLDSSSRVIELAGLIGCTYVLGLSNHWRKLERETCRDIFLHYYLEPKQSRLIRRNLYQKCQDYIATACVRNKVGDEMAGITLQHHTKTVTMSKAEGDLYKKSQSGIPVPKKSFAITPEDFDVSAGHDITKFLRQNVDLACRKQKLVDICRDILKEDNTTKIIVFADGRIGGGISARTALNAEGDLGCTWLDEEDSTEVRNQKISWYQHGDVTEEDKNRPRVLVLHFEHAAGLNLQAECYNVVFFSPLYVGSGGPQSDAVADVSTELQATGRVFRPGQTHPVVNLFRIEVRGPDNEDCLDQHLIRRNTDEETMSMAVNSD